MDLDKCIGLELDSVIEILTKETCKKLIIKDNNSNVQNFNRTSVVRIKEKKDYIEIITSNFILLNN